ncbi:er lumen protein-retaining receptor c28h8.4-related [Citrus sinensis]|uniref:Er lumen protein-retaining receptor c28h8.4-related n=1 Tax=Citrus sinensis TaxID=2711 RepID=A0ACB8MGK8_CITSI|nr:er lumen protein-retaining receptor c28h8.4-related [Citrus sinensis]
MGTRRGKSPVNAVLIWLMRQPMKVKSCLAVVFTVCSLVAMKLFVKNHDYFFVASEAIHAAGIMVLIYKLTTKNTCSGLSLKTQELTAMFLALRLVCSIIMEADIHTVLDFATLASTAWVIYMIRFKLKSTYIKELDNFPIYYILIETRGRYLFLLGHGYLWFPVAFLAEMIQTFILADFCYYYIKSLKEGQLLMRMPI